MLLYLVNWRFLFGISSITHSDGVKKSSSEMAASCLKVDFLILWVTKYCNKLQMELSMSSFSDGISKMYANNGLWINRKEKLLIINRY